MKPNAITCLTLSLAIGIVLGLAANQLALWVAVGVALSAVLANRQAPAGPEVRRSR